MGKPKQKRGTSSRKFKELKGQFDDLGEEVLKIESTYLLYCLKNKKKCSHHRFCHNKELMRPRNERDNILMTQRMEVCLNHMELPEKEVASVTTCRLRWVSLAARMNKYTCRSW
jgi:hypothetical protein